MTFYVEDESKREWPFSVRNLLEAVAIQTLARSEEHTSELQSP